MIFVPGALMGVMNASAMSGSSLAVPGVWPTKFACVIAALVATTFAPRTTIPAEVSRTARMNTSRFSCTGRCRSTGGLTMA